MAKRVAKSSPRGRWGLKRLSGVLLCLGLWIGLSGCQEPTQALPVNSRLGGDFTLTDQHSKPFHSQQLRGKVVVLFFGYTQCPDICPATLARVAQVYRNLTEAGLAQRLQPVFVSFDPERDTPEQLQAYLPWFKANLIGLTGTPAAVSAVAAQYGVVVIPGDELAEEQGAVRLFTHSDYVYLLDVQGRVRKVYPSDFPIEEMVTDVRSLL